MLVSDIVVNSASFAQDVSAEAPESKATKIGHAYSQARKEVEKMELELKRPKIFIIDEHGKLVKQTVFVEH